MKDTKTKTSINTKEGWSIHVYDQERHLRCTLGPAHGWSMGVGLVLGILVTVLVSNIDLPINVHTPAVNPSEPSADPIEENSLSMSITVD